MPLPDVKSLAKRVEEAAKILEEHLSEDFLIIYHYDGDGIAGAGALCKVLLERGAPFVARSVQELDANTIDTISRMPQRVKLFIDIGSGYPGHVERATRGNLGLIVDHHQPLSKGEEPSLFEVNPHHFHLDGARAACGASLTAYLAYILSGRKMPHILRLGFVGVVSDMQLVNGKVTGFNRFLLREAEALGVVRARIDLVYALSKEKPIHKAIASTYNPFIPDLSGREDNAVALLTKVGIKLRDEKGKWRTFAALSDDEKDRLLAGIAEWILKEPVPEAITSLLTTIFEFPGEEDELATAQSVSELINATARMGASHVGLRLAMMPDRHALEQAKELVEKRREQLAHIFQAIERKARAKRLRATLFVDGRGLVDERLASSVATILSTSPANKGLYVVVVSTPRNGAVKVSARAAKLGLPNPRNLGLVLSELASKHGGFGGGHSVAAGARILENEVETFVAELDNALREGDDNQSEDNTRF